MKRTFAESNRFSVTVMTVTVITMPIMIVINGADADNAFIDGPNGTNVFILQCNCKCDRSIIALLQIPLNYYGYSHREKYLFDSNKFSLSQTYFIFDVRSKKWLSDLNILFDCLLIYLIWIYDLFKWYKFLVRIKWSFCLNYIFFLFYK